MYEELIEKFKIRVNSFGDMENKIYEGFKDGTNNKQVRDTYNFMEAMEKVHQEVKM